MTWRQLVWFGIACLGLGCESGGEATDSLGRGGNAQPGIGGPAGVGTGSPFGNGTGGAGGSGNDPDVPAPLPPEIDIKLDFELPQASERFVYAANPDSGTVVIIDANTLAIQTVETGDRPTFLRTLTGTDDAIVLNVGSDDATILRSPGTGVRTSTVDVVRGANAIAVAPDSKHAVVYFNVRAADTTGMPSSSFQDVTVLTLDGAGDTAIGMTVGFRPRDVFFAADGNTAYVVNDDGVSVLDFAQIERDGSGIARLVSLGQDFDQTSLDVSVTPDGRFALARQPGQSVVRLVDLDDGKIRSLELSELSLPTPDSDEDGGTAAMAPIEVSDLKLAPTGTFALAVLRNQFAVLRIPVPEAFDDPDAVHVYEIENQLVGSVEIAPAADRALLFTNAVDLERITVLPLTGDEEIRTVQLRKSVLAVAIAPDGETALIMHKKADGDPNESGLNPDAKIDRSHGYSVLRVGTGDVKLQVTPVAAGAFTIVPDSGFVFILFRNDALGVREVQKIDTTSFLVEPIGLGSPPISVGTVPGSERVFVNQEHADGRITLIDWKTSETRTVTGFELNSRIRD